MENTICKICDGAGGWRKPITEYLGDNWMDCILCDGFGFHEKNEEEEESATLLDYTKQTSVFRDELERFGRVFKFMPSEHGTKIEINIVPDSRDNWIKLVKKLLLVSNESSSFSVMTKQVFFCARDGKYKYYWEVHIEVENLIDLEILADYVGSLELKKEEEDA
jgi:hypothetical protein